MAEQFANNFRTTLSVAIGAADTSLTLASVTGTGIGTAPTAPFRIRIDDELILVTVRSGTACTIERGIEGTTAAAHAAGAVLRQVFTVGGLNAAIADRLPIVQQFAGSYLITGGQIVWTSAFNFTVSSAIYYIAGTIYNSPQTNITLSASHATLNRIDVIVVNSSSAVVVVEGTAAAQPAEPEIDPATQLKLGIVLVNAATTQPPSTSNTTLYAENAGSGGGEWDWATSGGTWDLASTINPRTGTKCISGTALTSGSYIEGTIGSGTVDPLTLDFLIFYLRLDVALPNKRSLSVSLRNGSTVVGSAVSAFQFGLDPTNVSTYQQVAIPVSTFAAASAFNKVRITVGGTTGTFSTRFDDIYFQVGGSLQPGGGLTQEQADARYVLKTSAAGGKRSWGAVIGNGSDVITTGTKGYSAPIPFAGTIRKVTLTVIDAAFTSGSIVVDIWKKNGAVPTNSDSITAAAKPTLSSATAYEDSTLAGWTPTVAVGDRFGWEVESASLVKQVHINLEIE